MALRDDKTYRANQMRERRARAGEVGEIPPPADLARREAALASPQAFAETYMSGEDGAFYNAFEAVHVEVLEEVQHVLLYGGRKWIVAPRGMGKTSLMVRATIPWALLSGRVRFLVYMCENKRLSMERLRIIAEDMECSDELYLDFPEVCHPVRALGGVAQRAASQTYQGQLTKVEWKRDSLRLPEITGLPWGERLLGWPGGRSPSSGALVRAAGMTEGVRGLLSRYGRPDMVVIDDPQGDETAASGSAREKTGKLIRKGLAELGGQGRNLALFGLATIIERGDVADEFSDPARQPSWSGRRYRMLMQEPDRADLWEKYIELRRGRDPRKDPDAREAWRFYRDNREAMDAGAEVALHHVHIEEPTSDGTPRQLSSLQRCYDKIADDGWEAFRSEYQNDPIDPLEDGANRLVPAEVCERLSGVPRGVVPAECRMVTAFVDVGSATDVHWTACAWAADFTGSVIDYGRERVPETQADGVEAAVYGAVRRALERCCRRWVAEDGTEFPTERCLVDRGWQQGVVYRACRECGHDAAMPSRGIGVQPGSEFYIGKGRGVRSGEGMRLAQPRDQAYRSLRQIEYHSALWKTFTFERLRTPMGGRSRLALFGSESPIHREFARHLAGEYRVPVVAKEQASDTWHQVPGEPNHWWDCVVGCVVAARYQGVALLGEPTAKHQAVPFSQRFREAKERRL